MKTDLIIEDFPDDYEGYRFIALIGYQENDLMLSIIDNIHGKSINAYILDLCAAENVNEELIVTIANEWFHENKNFYPLSIEFSKRGLTDQFSKIYKTFHMDYIYRLMGFVPAFNIINKSKTKRCRIKIY